MFSSFLLGLLLAPIYLMCRRAFKNLGYIRKWVFEVREIWE